jgi:hypothetical protein
MHPNHRPQAQRHGEKVYMMRKMDLSGVGGQFEVSPSSTTYDPANMESMIQYAHACRENCKHLSLGAAR